MYIMYSRINEIEDEDGHFETCRRTQTTSSKFMVMKDLIKILRACRQGKDNAN